MNNKKNTTLLITLIALLSLIIVISIIMIFSKKSNNFEAYIYSSGKVDNSFKILDKTDSYLIYTKKGIFLDYKGDINLERNKENSSLLKNSFIITFDNSNEEKQLDDDIQKFIKDFKEYINYNGEISHALIPNGEEKIDYDKSVLKNVLEEKATLLFSISSQDKNYDITVYKEKNKITLELSYKPNVKNSNNKIPDHINGVG